jgi:ribosomal protein L40E
VPPVSAGVTPLTKSNGAASPEIDTIVCKQCSAQNPNDGKYCYSCGELLEIPERGNTVQLELSDPDPAMFGNLSTLLIAVRGHEQSPLHVHVQDQPLVIGRTDDARDGTPDVDLAPFGAKNHGVSRSHAVLKRQDNTITLTDQGSINHT